MSRLVLIDGVSYSPDEAKISVYDRGFLYGDSAFETVRTYGGVLFALDEHMGRLEESARSLGIHMPVTVLQLAEETERGVREAANSESYARVMLSRGRGPLGLDPALALEALRVVIIEPLALTPVADYRNGIAAQCVQTVRASDAIHSAKLGNYLASAMALRTAQESGAKEALVVNREGVVIEGTTSNLFAVKEGILLTPPIEAGILAGITRGIIIELAERGGLKVEYCALSPEELLRCEEVFITSSIREVLPVVRVNGQEVADGRPGPNARRLHRAFWDHVGLEGKPMPFELAAS